MEFVGLGGGGLGAIVDIKADGVNGLNDAVVEVAAQALAGFGDALEFQFDLRKTLIGGGSVVDEGSNVSARAQGDDPGQKENSGD